MAAERGLTLSHLVRELVAEAVSQRAAVAKLDGRALAERLAADVTAGYSLRVSSTRDGVTAKKRCEAEGANEPCRSTTRSSHELL
jgi:hypothetical protein